MDAGVHGVGGVGEEMELTLHRESEKISQEEGGREEQIGRSFIIRRRSRHQEA
jgi:hypothetical protein